MNVSSYRRLDRSKSRAQLASNSLILNDGGSFGIAELLEINDYTYRTPILKAINSEDYLQMRQRVIDLISGLSIDLKLPGRQSDLLQFDKLMTNVILEIFPMTRHESSNRDVWSYITLRVLPDVASWRYPNRADDPNWERFIGDDRNVFKRLWWRAELLGPELAVQLQEDDLVQMFERTESIGSNSLIMRTMVNYVLGSREKIKQLGGKSSAIYVETAKSLQRSMAVVAFEAMSNEELEEYVIKHAEDAYIRISKSA